MKFICICLGYIIEVFNRACNKCKKMYILSRTKACGTDVYMGEEVRLTPETISLGNHIYIGPKCVFQSIHGEIKIGNHVMIGPGVHIHGGNHVTDEIGCFLDDTKPKVKGSDGKVIIEDDVWIGANSIILKGVCIHTGSVVGAGSIVTKDIPPYSIYINQVHPVIKSRFTEQQVKIHLTTMQEAK